MKPNPASTLHLFIFSLLQQCGHLYWQCISYVVLFIYFFFFLLLFFKNFLLWTERAACRVKTPIDTWLRERQGGRNSEMQEDREMGEGLRPSKSEMGQKDRKRERQKAAAHLSPSTCNSSDTMSLKNTAGICSERERPAWQTQTRATVYCKFNDHNHDWQS